MFRLGRIIRSLGACHQRDIEYIRCLNIEKADHLFDDLRQGLSCDS